MKTRPADCPTSITNIKPTIRSTLPLPPSIFSFKKNQVWHTLSTLYLYIELKCVIRWQLTCHAIQEIIFMLIYCSVAILSHKWKKGIIVIGGSVCMQGNKGLYYIFIACVYIFLPKELIFINYKTLCKIINILSIQ